MRILLIDAYAEADPDRGVVAAAATTLSAAGHDVDHHCLAAQGFTMVMSEAERAAYHQDNPLLTDETRAAADAVAAADALLFCYPTTTFTVPARLKGWLERVMVPGVSFVFDAKGRVAPGLTNIRRLGVITTTPHSRRATRRARDQGRRTILWTIRLSCHRLCRRTFVSLPAGAPGADGGNANDPGAETQIRRALRRW